MEERARQMGAKLREQRKHLALTMQEVADRAGLSVGFISQVERGLTVPSLSSLVSISQVLALPVGTLLEQPHQATEVSRNRARQPYSLGQTGLSYERLSAAFPGNELRSVLMHEEPGHRDEPISHAGEELMFVLRGELTVELEGVPNVLGPGDSIHFDSRRPHMTWNHTDAPTTVIWCGTMDVFGDGEVEPDPIHKNETA